MTTNPQRLLAFILIALGGLAILARISGSMGWLIIGLIAAALLWTYIQKRHYAFLVSGSLLTGIAIGILLEGVWGWNGAFLISLGLGFLAIDKVEKRENRWPVYVGSLVVGLGLLIGLLVSGFLGSLWFALLLIIAGILLILRSDKTTVSTDNWGHFDTKPKSSSASNNESTQGQSIVDEAINSAKTDQESKTEPLGKADKNSESPEHSSTSQTIQVASNTLNDDTAELNPKLLSSLEQWRRETAKLENRAAYLILSNESLRLIATNKPQSPEALHSIKGIGKVKLERYGTSLLSIIKLHLAASKDSLETPDKP